MDISLIIYSGLGAALGAATGKLISRAFFKDVEKETNSPEEDKKGNKTVLTVILTIIGLNVLPLYYKDMTLPRLAPIDTRAFNKDMPVLNIIQDQNPELYQNMLKPLDKALRNNDFTQDELNEFREAYLVAITEKRKIASAKTLRKSDSVATLQLEILKEKEPTYCTLIFYGRPYPRLDEILGTDFGIKEQAALTLLFTESPRPQSYVPDLEMGKSLFDQIAAIIIEENNITDLDPKILPSNENILEHKKICDFQSSLFAKKAELNDAEMLNVNAYLASLE